MVEMAGDSVAVRESRALRDGLALAYLLFVAWSVADELPGDVTEKRNSKIEMRNFGAQWRV